MYIIVRHDLKSKGYQAAQSGHALAQYMMEHKPHENGHWENDYLIFLETKTIHCLDRLMYKLEKNGFSYSKFHEPDMDNELTAIAALNIDKLVNNFDTL